MKYVPVILLVVSLCSCRSNNSNQPSPTDVFTQGDITIVLPVKRDENGYTHAYWDGGSRGFDIIDSTGKKFYVFIDHSLFLMDGEHCRTQPGIIYINGDSETGTKIIDQTGFKDRVLGDIK